MNQFLWGALTLASAMAGLFFLKYWRTSRERLFLYFTGAFWIFAVHWMGAALLSPTSEHRWYLYLLRLAAFLLIVVGVLDKNRERD